MNWIVTLNNSYIFRSMNMSNKVFNHKNLDGVTNAVLNIFFFHRKQWTPQFHVYDFYYMNSKCKLFWKYKTHRVLIFKIFNYFYKNISGLYSWMSEWFVLHLYFIKFLENNNFYIGFIISYRFSFSDNISLLCQ